MSQIKTTPEQTPRSPRGNKRATVRYRCAPATIGKLYVSQDHEYQHAWVLDLSAAGIGLILNRAVPIGAVVAVQLKSNDQTQTFELAGHVVYCTALPGGDWSVGCELVTPLSAEDLDRLL